jgi:ABC-type multidrug transport system ATPase subunit
LQQTCKMSQPESIALTNLSYELPVSDRQILDALNCTSHAGDLLAVVGPNGGGKTTLLLLLAGLLRPTSGRVTINGIDAHLMPQRAPGQVGLVTARSGLLPLLTGRENLHHFAGLYGVGSREVDERAEPLLTKLEIPSLDRRVSELSTGMQQKLSLLRALLMSPKLLLLDEPTANLDPVSAAAFLSEVRARVDDGLSCVLVTHDLSSVESVCDRAILLNKRIVKEVAFKGPRKPTAGPLLTAWRESIR